MSLAHRIADEPYAGAQRYLRHIDPLYQSEIGLARDWEAHLYAVCSPGCSSQCCRTFSRSITVEATTAEQALTLAAEQAETTEDVEGVRVVGSNGDLWRG